MARNPAKNPARNPATQRARGKGIQEPQNQRTPPKPPEGGHDGAISIIEDYVTPSGRRRQRTVVVDLDRARSRLLSPTPGDHADWRRIRASLQAELGAEMFAIWLDALQLIASDDGVLLLACPADTRAWVSGRYAALLDRVSCSHGRRLRLSSDSELRLYRAIQAAAPSPCDEPLSPDHDQEAV